MHIITQGPFQNFIWISTASNGNFIKFDTKLELKEILTYILRPFPHYNIDPCVCIKMQQTLHRVTMHINPRDHLKMQNNGKFWWSLKVVVRVRVRVRVRVGEKPSWEFKLLTISLFVHGFSPNLEVFILVWVEVCHKLWILLNCQNIGLIGDNRVPGSLKVVVGKAELRAESGF